MIEESIKNEASELAFRLYNLEAEAKSIRKRLKIISAVSNTLIGLNQQNVNNVKPEKPVTPAKPVQAVKPTNTATQIKPAAPTKPVTPVKQPS